MLLDQISQETVKTWELDDLKQWNPTQIETKEKIPNILFVQSNDNLVLISTQ